MRASRWIGMLALTVSLPSLQGHGFNALNATASPAPVPDVVTQQQKPAKISKAPSAASASTEIEREVIAEMTLARTQPKRYATFLRQLRSHYEGNLFKESGRITIATKEGVRALDQAIAFLEFTPPVGPLEWNEVLFLAARDHARDQSRTTTTGHAGSDGSTMSQRIERYGNWSGSAAENIEYGDSDARRITINLIVDDGVASRGHRRNIFNLDLKTAGAAIAAHRTYRNVCVIDFAAAVSAKRDNQ